MTLINHYLRAVRMYLPKREQDDILVELRENLVEKMEEQAAVLGRPLTEAEQEALLMSHGSPMTIAEGYGSPKHGFAFGVELISPEVFPLYIRILLFIFAIDITVIPLVGYLSNGAFPQITRFAIPMAAQFVIATLSGMIGSRFRERRPWNFPPSYLQPIPRWQSVSALIFWSAFAAWWTALPSTPAIGLGSYAERVTLAPVWSAFFWPVIAIALVGVAQRTATLLRPEWSLLQPPTRLAMSLMGLVVIYLMLQAPSFVVPIDGNVTAPVPQIVDGLNKAIWWNLSASLGLYVAINAAFNAWMCAQHVSYLRRRRQVAAAA